MATTHLIQPIADPHNGGSPADTNRPVLLGDSVAVRHLRSQIQRIAPYFRVAMIRGESGSGKQVVARAVHARSAGGQGPFIVADAATFADAVDATPRPSALASLLDVSEGGTLYLTRMAELSVVQQDALMRFFRNRWERRAASSDTDRHKFERRQSNPTRARACDMRLLIASERDLRALAAVGRFRQDLYAQLAAVEIVVPPLRERLNDIPVLANWLLRWLAEQTGQNAKHFSQAAQVHLQERRWPRNLRELEEIVAQAAALTESSLIEPQHLSTLGEPATVTQAPASPPRIERLNEVVQRHVLDVLTRCGGNKLRTAELLGISRSTLYRMLDSNADVISALRG